MEQIFFGTIVVSAPKYGIALVQVGTGAPSMTSIRIGHLPYIDAGCGAVVQQQLVEGTAVACMEHNDAGTLKTYIIGPANNNCGEKDDMLRWRNFYNVDVFKTNHSKALVAVLDGMLKKLQFQQFRDHAHSVDQDALPGDFDVKDKFGANGVHVGRLLSQLHGSPLAYIDVEAMYNTSRRVADNLEDHTLLSMEVQTPEYHVHNIAINESESFGLRSEPPFTEEGADNIELTDDKAIPFYRVTNIAGAGIDGIEQTVNDFPKDEDTHTSGTEPQILAKRRTSIMGAMSQASVANIQSIKSPLLTGVHQLGYGKTSKQDPDRAWFDDILEPYEGEPPEDPEEPKPDPADALISDAAINKVIDKLLSSEYVKVLKKRMLENGLIVSDPEKTFGKMHFDEDDLEPVGGPINKQQYDLPKSIELEDPVTGRKQIYYASTSFITQEDDGSILIADGYGSEIRMSRGNIYISPALDLFFRPGRDLSSMVPRHQAFNTQGTLTLNSDDSIYIRGTKDLKMTGATDGTGVVLLESKATEGYEFPGGVVIKSNSNLSLTGKDLYLGRNAHVGRDKGSVNEPEQPGMIVIDSGVNGVIMERSKAHTVESQTFIVASTGGSSNSAFTVAQSMIGMYTRQVVMPAMLNMQTMEGPQTLKILRDGKEQEVTLSTSNTIGLRINGSIIATGSLHCNGSGKFCKGMVANGIISNSELNSVPGEKDRDVFKEVQPDSTSVLQGLNAGVCGMLKQVSGTVYQDYYVVGNEFAFPLTYNIDANLRMPGMLWQVIAENKDTYNEKYVWKERYIKGIDGTETACYPGIDVWTSGDAVISTKEYKTHSLATGYVMNAERTNNDD